MEDSIDLLQPNDTEICNGPSLLLLNDDCLARILKNLELLDLVNVSKTCVRFKNIATDTFNHRFEIITVNDHSDSDYTGRYRSLEVSRRQFRDILSVIGWRVHSVEMYYEGYDTIFRAVASKCKNVTSLALLFIEYPVLSLRTCPHLLEFKMLTKLRIVECDIANSVLRQIFLNNPNIDHLEFDCTLFANRGPVKLLEILPKLKTLHLQHIQGLGVNKVPNLFHLKEVNDFKFYDERNCNKFITELAAKWQLVSLDLTCDTDDETFDLLRLFENLESLSMANMTKYCTMPERTVFPSKLKRISFNCISFTLRKFASMVDELKMLEFVFLKTNCLMDFSRKLFLQFHSVQSVNF